MKQDAQEVSEKAGLGGDVALGVRRILEQRPTPSAKASALLDLLASSKVLESDDEDEDEEIDEPPEVDPWSAEVPLQEGPVNAQIDTDGVDHAQISVGIAHARRQRKLKWIVLCFPCYLVYAVVKWGWAAITVAGKSCASVVGGLRGSLQQQSEVGAKTESQQVTQVAAQGAAINRFELFLRKSLCFEDSLVLQTTAPEPNWVGSGETSGNRLFPGWNAASAEYPLRPQGRFVAETGKAIDKFLANVELGVDVQVMGNGGGFSSTGLPALLKTAFTPYQWLGMWRSSEGRLIRVAPSVFGGGDVMQPPHSDRLLTREIDQLQTLENELLGLDKFKGGDSEYITVITHSDEYAGSVSLFQATFSDDHELIKLDRVAMMTDVPKQICRMLRQEAGPSKYELSRAGSKLKCLTSGGLPRPCIARVSTQAGPWPTTGRGWRSALQIPLYNPRYTTGEGLIATVPQMMAFLHLRFLSATDVWSSQALAFEGPLAIGGSSIRRGVRLAGSPRGFPHVGKHTKIAVLFPADGNWAQEQFFWA